jgi:hypothetical protein
MMARLLMMAPAVLAMYLPFCAAEVRPILVPAAPPASLWQEPTDLAERDLFYGPWGPERAPNPAGRYTLVERKHSGVNPGLTVRDGLGREWSVKQVSPGALAAEGPIEVVLSRVLSAVGYHQPPVYYLPAFTLADDWGPHTEPGGRFRPKEKTLKDRGEWSWQQNPFVGTQPYQGLLVVLLMFNSTDLKNSNNTLYEHRGNGGVEHWYVVRDLGAALGSTGRLAPQRGDADAFARHDLITGVKDGFVAFNYHGWHQELFRERIRPDDVAWASELLARLDDRQWRDAFRAGGYTSDAGERFIRTLRRRIADGEAFAAPRTVKVRATAH